MIINAALSPITLQSPQTSPTKTAQQQPAASQTQPDSSADQLAISAENLEASTFPINDSSDAQAILQGLQSGILQQSNTAMLAQANLNPDTVLQLLQD